MKTRILSLLLGVALALWCANCACPDEDCKDCPTPVSVPNLAYMSIFNQLPQQLFVPVGTENFFWREATLFPYYGPGIDPVSQEDIVIFSLTIEDTFTGTGSLNEIDNLKVVANLNGCATMDNPTVIGSAISVPYGTSPQLLSIDLDIPIVLGSTDCILIRIYGDLLATADTETPGTHNIEFVGATAYGLDSFQALTLDNQHLYVDRQFSPVVNTPPPGSLMMVVTYPYHEDILIAGAEQQKVATFVLYADEKEAITLDTLKITDLGDGTAISTCYLYSNRRNDGQPITDPIAIAVMTPTQPASCIFPADKVTVIAGAPVALTIKVDLNTINEPFVQNGDIFQIVVNDPANDLTGYGALSRQLIGAEVGYEIDIPMVIMEARPNFSVASYSPRSPLIASSNTLLAIFKMNALNGDISFENSAGNYLTIIVSSKCQGAGIPGDLSLKDQNGQLLSYLNNVDLCQKGPYTFNFNNQDVTLAAGSHMDFYIYGNTTAFSHSFDNVCISLFGNTDGMSNIGWSINNDGQNYGFGDIIFRGGIIANKLFH